MQSSSPNEQGGVVELLRRQDQPVSVEREPAGQVAHRMEHQLLK